MWSPIPGWEETYEASDAGHIRRKAGFWCKTNRDLVLHPGKAGYLRASLSARGRRNPRKMLVHRLVWSAFNGAVPDGLTVNHKNGVKADNRLENLELMTMREQQRHAYDTGLQEVARGEARGRVATLTSASVLEIRRRHAAGDCTTAALGAEYGVSGAAIGLIVNRRRWTHI